MHHPEKTPYETMTVDEIVTHFSNVSRQMVSLVTLRYKKSADRATYQKILEAKSALKEAKYTKKYGLPSKVNKRLQSIWAGMNQRCGNKSGRAPAYTDVTNEFTSYEEFAVWAAGQIGFDMDGWEIDKDVLIKGNRVYGPNTCIFLPVELNVLFVGSLAYSRRGAYPVGVTRFVQANGTVQFRAQMVRTEDGKRVRYLGSFRTPEEAFQCYKKAKEARVRELAEQYKDKIDPRAYEALMKWEVEITD